MKNILAIGIILFTLLGAGCTSETANYDPGIEAYKRGQYEVALYEFERRAVKGDRVAQFGLGVMYERGKGVAKNLKEAEGWYKKSAKRDYAPAQNNLGLMYFRRIEDMLSRPSTVEITSKESEELKSNIDIALQWVHKAEVHENNRVAQYNLALISGEGIRLNEPAINLASTTVDWLTKAADQNYAAAQFELGKMYAEGKGVDMNLSETERWEKAVQWYTKAANQNYDIAQNALGEMYAEGKGVDKNLTEDQRWEEAVQWYKKAANPKKGNSADAQFNLANMYRQGKGVDKNLTANERRAKALEWYEKAANQDNGDAQNNLATMYDEDYEKDVENKEKSIKGEMAVRLFFLAAQQDYPVAQVNIGRSFEGGIHGVTQDYEEAYYWYSLALRDPDHLDWVAGPQNLAAIVTESRESVAAKLKLTPDQKTQIRQQIDNWQPKDSSYWMGTGFYINQNYILTNAHVVTWKDKDDEGKEQVHEFDEFCIPYRRVKLVKKDSNVDLALLYDENGSPDAAIFRGHSVVVGEWIYSFGYPQSHKLSYAGNATPGIVSGPSGMIKVPNPDNYFQHTAPIQGGNSGGPVFDLSGNVVGVTKYGLTGTQNVNFAIRFDVIKRFLSENGINVDIVEEMAEDSTKAANLQDIYKDIPSKAGKFTVPVLSFKKFKKKESRFRSAGVSVDIDMW